MSAAYDVVVIGGGIAGLTSAGRAAQAGLRVAVLERGTDEQYACNSRYSGGILHIAFHNIREPAAALLEVIETATRGKAAPELAKAFADNAARVVDWLRDEGIEFMSVGNIAYQQWVFAPRRPLTPGLDWKGRGADVAMRLIPNRDPDTLAPKPFGYALRANACVWNSVVQMDQFVAATQELVRKMTM